MALSGDNPFIAIDPTTGLPKPGQPGVKVPETEAEKARWFAVQEAWAAFNRNGDTSLLREVWTTANEREGQCIAGKWEEA